MKIDYYSYSLVPAAVDNFILAVTRPMPCASLPARSARFSRSSRFRVWNLHTDCRTDCIHAPKARLFGTERCFGRAFWHVEILYPRANYGHVRLQAFISACLFPEIGPRTARISTMSRVRHGGHACFLRFMRSHVQQTREACAKAEAEDARRIPACVGRIYNGMHMSHAMQPRV